MGKIHTFIYVHTHTHTHTLADSGSSSYGEDSEDSDWAPTHRNDDDHENIKELLSDAKEFISNKKMRT